MPETIRFLAWSDAASHEGDLKLSAARRIFRASQPSAYQFTIDLNEES